MNHMRIGRQVLTGALALGLLTAASTLSAVASGPDVSRNTSFSYTLADSMADYADDPANNFEVDCGTFKVISTFDVTRTIITWPDREFRHIVYSGFYVNASDTSKMIPRNGDFERTTWFDANGDFIRRDQRGVQIWTVLGGKRVNLVIGLGIDDPTSYVHYGLERDQTEVCGPLS